MNQKLLEAVDFGERCDAEAAGGCGRGGWPLPADGGPRQRGDHVAAEQEDGRAADVQGRPAAAAHLTHPHPGATLAIATNRCLTLKAASSRKAIVTFCLMLALVVFILMLRSGFLAPALIPDANGCSLTLSSRIP